jgi:hypothetical protein
VIVVGGTYIEVTDYPLLRTVAGSGLRAAGALSETGGVRLLSAVDVPLADEARSIAAGLGIKYQTVERDQTVAFRYFTPLSSPVIDGPGAVYRESIVAQDDTILVFGMIERGEWSAEGRTVVLDPQRPRDLTGVSRDGISADRLALVCNRAEVRAIGGSDDLTTAARAAGASVDAEVVVVKRGAVGCTVVHGDRVDHIGPHPTRTVWPIGSGDVFAAGFAHAWANGADPAEAARVGSSAGAWWCGNRSPTVPLSLLNGDLATLQAVPPAIDLVDAPRVYLAGPFFCLGQQWLIETAREALRGLGASVFSPLHDVGPGGDEVAAKDLDGLLIDGYDAGTIYECGWARKARIPVVAHGANATAEGAKTLVGDGVEIHADFTSAVYRSVWAAMGARIDGARVPGPLDVT